MRHFAYWTVYVKDDTPTPRAHFAYATDLLNFNMFLSRFTH